MAEEKVVSRAQLVQMSRSGAHIEDVEDDDNGHRTIEGLAELVAQIKSLVEAQRANAGADMLRSETQTQLIQAVQKLASRAPGKGMSQKVLEDLVVQLGEQRGQEREPNPVYVFTFERFPSGYISKVTATPQAS